MPQPFLSLIVPMYNEEATVALFFERTIPVLTALEQEWEILCIDDGSRDGTYARLSAFHQQEPRIKIIRLSRNFGKEAALSAGIDAARGKVVVPLDADLQDPPELIPDMIAEWQKGFKVVIAVRSRRDSDTLLKRLTAHCFYKSIDRMADISIPPNAGDFRLMDEAVIQALRQLPERSRFMKGLFAWVGFPTTQIYYERPGRAAGTTSWNYWKLWQLALDGIISFSTLPLKLWTYIGLSISLLSFAYGLFIIIKTTILGVEVPGYASLMTAILFIGGIQLISLGVIGEYLGRVCEETKRRPLYLVAETRGME